jgi:hypothetical protein
MDEWWTEPESFEAAKRELETTAAGVRLVFLKGYVTGAQRMAMEAAAALVADYDPTDEEQGPLEQGWAESRQYDKEHGNG